MKQGCMLLIVLCFGLTLTAVAQTGQRQKKVTTQRVHYKKAAARTPEKIKAQQLGGETLTSISSNQAYANGGNRLMISDSTIRVLNERANNYRIPISSSGIVGMPKGTYGYLNGKLLLRQTTANSSGTVFGSGAVGTGTTQMGVGTGANTPGLNGKNPYAGPSFWGSKTTPQNLTPSTNKTGSVKQ